MIRVYIFLILSLIIGVFSLTSCVDTAHKESIAEIYEYVSFEKDEYSLYSTEGSYVVLLTKDKLKEEDAEFLIDYLDLAWFFYAARASSKPRLNSHYNGKVIIAEVDNTCGAGCAYIGATGIEIEKHYMKEAIEKAKQKQVDRIFLYEMGRNWWLYNKITTNNNLLYTKAISTGFAVYMAFRAADYLKEQGYSIGTFNEIPFDEFQKESSSIVDLYIERNLTYSNTISINIGVQSIMFSESHHLFASILTHIDKKFTNNKLSNTLWKELSNQPETTEEKQSIVNIVNAISKTLDKDMVPYFKNTLKFDILK